jgi:hypothetical protein
MDCDPQFVRPLSTILNIPWPSPHLRIRALESLACARSSKAYPETSPARPDIIDVLVRLILTKEHVQKISGYPKPGRRGVFFAPSFTGIHRLLRT